jgi:predicted dehydrogenase/nucleoside-diphosphate-sugar epimerase
MRLALVGCGAVSREYYIPALRSLPEHPVEWFVDTSEAVASRAVAEYGQGMTERDYRAVIDKVDAAIVAVPNFLHSEVSIGFLQAGRDVLCEKPIATSVEQATRMIRAAENSGARLAVNQIRRRFENYQAAKQIIGQGLLGRVKHVSYHEGQIFSWPVASSFILDKCKAGGGPLIDWGPYAIDILRWLFVGELEVVRYLDDSLGRIESNCDAVLKIVTASDAIPCSLKLSRSRTLRNSIVIEGENTRLEVPHYVFETYLTFGDGTWRMRQKGKKPKSVIEHFADQVRSFLDRSSSDIVEGPDALRTLSVIEECYKKREDMRYPWDPERRHALPISTGPRWSKILVVGASGFLGTRLVERLTLDLKATVRAGVHRPETAARLARLPVEFVNCDLLKAGEVDNCVQGCDAVVNCASSGNRTFQVLRDGTRNLLDACLAHNVKKFIQISSVAVQGFKHSSRTIDESTRYKFSFDPYVRGKIESERLVRRYGKEMPFVILRPTLIYGPFSMNWVLGIADRVRTNRVTLIGERGIANLVFVDDVVDAILLALETDGGDGQTFIINNDQDVVLWQEYIQKICDLFTARPARITHSSRIVYNLHQTLTLIKDSANKTSEVLRSPETISLLTRIPLVVAVGAKLIKGNRRKKLESALASPLELTVPDLRQVFAYETVDKQLYDVLSTNTLFSSAKAKKMLGFEPRTTFEDGIKISLNWLNWMSARTV